MSRSPLRTNWDAGLSGGLGRTRQCTLNSFRLWCRSRATIPLFCSFIAHALNRTRAASFWNTHADFDNWHSSADKQTKKKQERKKATKQKQQSSSQQQLLFSPSQMRVITAQHAKTRRSRRHRAQRGYMRLVLKSTSHLLPSSKCSSISTRRQCLCITRVRV